MLQRDYIMRLLQQFFEALEKLVEERDKKDGPELQLQLQSIYRAYFNHPSTFYYDQDAEYILNEMGQNYGCLLYTSPSPRDRSVSRMPSSA